MQLARAARDAEPDNAEANANLATALNMAGQHDAAIVSYEDALALDPDFAEAHFGLASALQFLGRHEEAIASHDRALAIDPDYAEAHCGRATSLRGLRRHGEAVVAYDQALTVDPDYVEALQGKAAALRALRRHDEALACCSQVLSLQPDDPAAHNAIALLLQRIDRHEAALDHLRRAIALRPDYADAHRNLGVILEEIGRLSEAAACFETAVRLDPRSPAGYYALFQSRKAIAGEPHLAALRDLADDIRAMPDDDAVLVHFTLGKALADIGEPDKGFEHLLQGNALQRGTIGYDEPAVTAFFDKVRAVFTPAQFASKGGGGDPSRTPIFIVGMPRSGSTLIEQVLASHPQVFAGGERRDFHAAMRAIGLERPGFAYPEAVAQLGHDDIRRLGAAYVARLAAVAPGADRITDKAPANFATVGLIHLALPNARIVHACRDPVDTCLSCFSTLFDTDQPFTFDLAELGRYYRGYARLMAHWHSVLPAGVLLDVQYEDVVADLETQARRVVAHCGLPWDPACLDFHSTSRTVRTASVTQVRQPIYATSVRRWRPSGDVLRPLLEALGYPD